MPGKKRNHWGKATTFQKRERERKDEASSMANPLGILRKKIVERIPPSRLELRDSKGQPISLPEVSILKERC